MVMRSCATPWATFDESRCHAPVSAPATATAGPITPPVADPSHPSAPSSPASGIVEGAVTEKCEWPRAGDAERRKPKWGAAVNAHHHAVALTCAKGRHGGGTGEPRLADMPLHVGVALHGLGGLGIDPGPGVDDEDAIVAIRRHVANGHAIRARATCDVSCQFVERHLAVTWPAERARKDVGTACGHGRECRSGADERTSGLGRSAVPANGHQGQCPVGLNCPAGELGCMPPRLCSEHCSQAQGAKHALGMIHEPGVGGSGCRVHQNHDWARCCAPRISHRLRGAAARVAPARRQPADPPHRPAPAAGRARPRG